MMTVLVIVLAAVGLFVFGYLFGQQNPPESLKKKIVDEASGLVKQGEDAANKIIDQNK